MMFALDSLGMLSTTKELADSLEGKGTRDMTRAQGIKGAFRVLTQKLGQLHVPLILTNHTYAQIGAYVPTQVQGGGSGTKYAASTIVMLTASKEKDADKRVTGVVIKCTLQKSRYTRPFMQVTTLLDFDKGLDRYYGLDELCLEAGLWKDEKQSYILQDGRKVKKSIIAEHPKEYFTPEVLAELDKLVQKKYKYGKNDEQVEDNDVPLVAVEPIEPVKEEPSKKRGRKPGSKNKK
jgi:hypothetical protein